MLFPTPSRDPELLPHRPALEFAFYNALNWQVAIGIPTVLFMQQLGADSFQVGLVFSWPFLLTPVQLFVASLLPRLGFKRVAMAGWNLRALCLLVPVGLCLLAPGPAARWPVVLMVAVMFVYSFFRAAGTATLTTWFYQLVPAAIRGRYWATDQLLAALAGLGVLGLSAGLFALLPPAGAFIIQYLIAAAGAWQACRLLRRLPDVERPKVIGLDRLLQETPRLVFARGLFRTYLWLSVLVFASITPIAPFTAYYLRAVVHLPTASIMIYAMLTYLGVIGANWLMRARMDLVGAKPFFRLAYLLYAAIAAGWLLFLATDGRWVALLPIFFIVQGVAAGCWTSANLSYLAQIVPEHDRALPVSIHAALVTFAGGCAPVIWGLLLKQPDGMNVRWFGVFFTTLLVVIGAMYGILVRLPEQARAGEPLLEGAWLLRPFRAMASLVTLIEPPDRNP